MLNENNVCFEEMRKASRDWNEAKKERKARKEQIISTNGWDSPEMEMWEQEDKAAEAAFPYTTGQMKAFWNWRASIEHQVGEYEMDDFLWDGEVTDFVGTLRKAGIETFVHTNHSTALMENIHAFIAAGCTMEGPCTIIHPDDTFWKIEGGDAPPAIKGIRFRVN